MFTINWESQYNPTSTYLGLAKVRLHGEWVLTAGCGEVDHGDANWPPVISLNQWFATTLDPFPTYAQNMTGTYTTTAGVTEFTYRWDLSAGS